MYRSFAVLMILFTLCSFSFGQRNEKSKLNEPVSIENKKSNKLHRFYDFNICIYINRNSCSETNNCTLYSTRYILCNLDEIWDKETNHSYEFNKNILYKIENRYHLNSSTPSEKDLYHTDTLKVKMSLEQMDKLFSLTHAFFQLDNSENLSTDLIPPPPPLYDGPNAMIDLDLGFRGNYYSVFIGYPKGNKNYPKIMEYINQIIK